ncbi:hypothetical protein HC928_09480, partial [bacterium]|nr:hypothetical protein [bacterium]
MTTESAYRSLPGPQTITEATLDNGLRILVYPTPHTRSVVNHGHTARGA